MGLVSCHSIESKSDEPKEAWEHKVLKITGKGIKSQAAQLNELGLQGWEVVSINTEVTTNYTNGYGTASVNVGTCAINTLFKRPILGMKAPNGRTAWEYNIVQIAGKKLSAQNKLLDDLGAQGWEAIGSFSELGTINANRYWKLCDIRTTSVDYTLRNTQSQTTSEVKPSTNEEGTPKVESYTKWEYKILQVGGKGVDAHTAMLNELGREGWLLVSTHTETGESGLQRSGWRAAYINTYAVDHIFKRKIEEPTTTIPVQ